MKIQITLDDILYPTLTEISSNEGLTEAQYASNIVTSFVERQYRATTIDKLNKASIEDIDKIKDSLDKPK